MQTTELSHFLITIILPLLCIIGILGNFLICMAIWLDRQLHNVTNYFLFSLALADLFVCTVVMPISFMVEFHQGKWESGFELCLLYVYSDVFLCTASIVHMSVISVDRYLGISNPLKMRNRSKTMIILKIVFVWMVTLTISCPIAIVALIDPTNILSRSQCVITNRLYMIYGSTFAFLIPSFIMAVTYVKTKNLLTKQASLLSETAVQKSKGEGLRRTLPRRAPISSTLNLNEINHKISTATDRTSTSAKLSTTLSCSDDELRLLETNTEDSQSKENRLRKLCVRTSSVFLSITSKFANQHSQKAEEIANEHKATRVLAVVFGCFFICWTPFFAANLANGFLGDKCDIPPSISSLFLWLGYVSSIINPLIYTIFNRRFRQAVFRIISCKCFKPLADTSSTNYSRSHVYLPADTNTWTNYERTPNIYSGGLNDVCCSSNSNNALQKTSAKASLQQKRYPENSFLQLSVQRTTRTISVAAADSEPNTCKNKNAEKKKQSLSSSQECIVDEVPKKRRKFRRSQSVLELTSTTRRKNAKVRLPHVSEILETRAEETFL